MIKTLLCFPSPHPTPDWVLYIKWRLNEYSRTRRWSSSNIVRGPLYTSTAVLLVGDVTPATSHALTDRCSLHDWAIRIFSSFRSSSPPSSSSTKTGSESYDMRSIRPTASHTRITQWIFTITEWRHNESVHLPRSPDTCLISVARRPPPRFSFTEALRDKLMSDIRLRDRRLTRR